MELTPKVFRDVQFREKLRGGYHPEDVDEFLEQAAVGVEELTERLRQAVGASATGRAGGVGGDGHRRLAQAGPVDGSTHC